MKKVYVAWFFWIVAATALHVFGNNFGTRVVFFASLVVPFFLVAAERLTARRATPPQSEEHEHDGATEILEREDAEEVSEIREYIPGDSPKSIHWKLSQKTDTLLVRDLLAFEPPEEDFAEAAEANAGDAKKIFPPLALAITLFIALCGTFLSMLEWGVGRLGSFSFGAFGHFPDGFFLVFNRMFLISEQNHAYRYVMFSVSAPQSEHDALVAMALAAFFALFGGLAFLLAYTKIPAAVAVILLVGVQVYFGVFPAAAWNILLFSALALIYARVDFRTAATAICTVTVIAATVWLIFPGENPALSDFSESVRDRFSFRAAADLLPPQAAPAPQDLPLHVTHAPGNGTQTAPPQEYRAYLDERAEGAEIGGLAPPPSLVPILLVIIAVLIVIAAVRYAPALANALTRKKRFDSPDRAAAIDEIFRHALEHLFARGLKRENILFSEYTPHIAALTSEEFARTYENAARLRSEAVYSSRPPDENARTRMKEFLREAKGATRINFCPHDRS